MHPDINPHVAEAFSCMPFGQAMTAKEISVMIPDGRIGTTSVNNALLKLAKAGYVRRGISRRYSIITWEKLRDLPVTKKAPRSRENVRVVRVSTSASGAENPTYADISLPAEPWHTEGASA